MPKYLNERKGLLDDPLYEQKLKDRGLKNIEIRRSINFNDIRNMRVLIMEEVVWDYGTTLHKLAVQYYGQGKYFWVIGLVNNKPTDAHYKIGDIVLIPGNPSLIESGMGEPDVKF